MGYRFNYFGCKNATGSENKLLITTPNIPLNEWTHIAVKYNATGISGYLNGIWNATQGGQTCPGTGYANPNYVSVGSYFSGGATYDFNGSLDNIKVYDDDLNEWVVDLLYNESSLGENLGKRAQNY